MVARMANKWTPLGFYQRLRVFVHEPSDLLLALHVGAFIAAVPALLRSGDLRITLANLRAARGRIVKSPRLSYERIARLRALCLRVPIFARHNTCYVRALTLYRFLDADDAALGVHFGIEHRDRLEERLRGHAWVTLHGKVLEGPQAVVQGRIREIPIAAERVSR